MEEFCSRLDGFFDQTPKDFRYAVEVRNAGLLGPDYRKVLETHRVAHAYNHWSYMPPLAEQQKRAEPYTKIVGELPEMRRDMVDLVKRAVVENRRAYVLVNNRREGNAPLTIQALSDQLRS